MSSKEEEEEENEERETRQEWALRFSFILHTGHLTCLFHCCQTCPCTVILALRMGLAENWLRLRV